MTSRFRPLFHGAILHKLLCQKPGVSPAFLPGFNPEQARPLTGISLKRQAKNAMIVVNQETFMTLQKPQESNPLVDHEDDESSTGSLDNDKDKASHKAIDEHLKHRIRLGGHITYRREDGTHVIEDKNGVRPIPENFTAPPQPDCAELKIRELAWMNRITAKRDGLDVWCEAISALAGDDIVPDEVVQLLTNLGKAKLIDGRERNRLLSRYLNERKNKS